MAIDGPAGAGKSTVARGVARALGFAHLDTGAMYRAVTAEVLHRGGDPADARVCARVARELRISVVGGHVLVGGRPVGREIRTRRVSAAVSAVSAHPGVRRVMVGVQRRLLGKGRVVAEGRDIGTVVYPSAGLKVFLTASVAERARRRARELHAGGDPVSLATLRREIARRDKLDSERTASPLRPARDAVLVDSTKKTARRVIADIAKLAADRGLL